MLHVSRTSKNIAQNKMIEIATSSGTFAVSFASSFKPVSIDSDLLLSGSKNTFDH